MSKFVVSKLAKEDLKSTARFTEKKWGREQRNFYLKQFDDTFFALAVNPEIGSPCDFIRKGYRRFPQGRHVIFYVLDSDIRIIRILHKNMDIESALEDS